MANGPDLPSSPGGSASRRASARGAPASFRPAQYVRRLLLGQGIAWLVVAAAWFGVWLAGLPPGLRFAGGAASVFWAGLKLLAIATAACLGAAEVGMSCQLRGGPRIVLAMTTGMQGAMLAAALIVAALLIMVGGTIVELMALG